MYNRKYDVENFARAQFELTGKYQLPTLYKQEFDILKNPMPFNFIKSKKAESVHFFIHDYQFERIFKNIERYIMMMKNKAVKQVYTADCSLYTDYPLAMQIWQTYKNRWCGAYFQSAGFEVIPTITWSSEDSFEFCFDGIEKGSIVAVSDVGTENNSFMLGYSEMLKRIRPSKVVLY